MEIHGKKLKIAQFIDSYFPAIDGVIMVVDNYATYLNQSGQDCCVIAPKRKGYIDQKPYEVIRCSGFKIPFMNYDFPTPKLDGKLNNVLRTRDFDIFHAHSPFGLGRMSLEFAREKKIPVVGTFHSQFKKDFKQYTKSDFLAEQMTKYVVKFFNEADKVWAVSPGAAKILKEYGCDRETEVFGNGCDFHYPNNEEELLKQVNEEYHLGDVPNVLLFVGRPEPQKNIYLSLHAMKLLKDKGLKFKFVIVGSGVEDEKVKKSIEALELHDDVIMTGRIMDRKKLSAFYLRSDLFVFPSSYDMAPLVHIEAAAHKTPSVLIEGTPPTHRVIDNVNGYLIQETAEALADKLQTVLSDKQQLKTVSENAYDTLYLNWEKVTEIVIEKYYEIIEEYKSKK